MKSFFFCLLEATQCFHHNTMNYSFQLAFACWLRCLLLVTLAFWQRSLIAAQRCLQRWVFTSRNIVTQGCDQRSLPRTTKLCKAAIKDRCLAQRSCARLRSKIAASHNEVVQGCDQRSLPRTTKLCKVAIAKLLQPKGKNKANAIRHNFVVLGTKQLSVAQLPTSCLAQRSCAGLQSKIATSLLRQQAGGCNQRLLPVRSRRMSTGWPFSSDLFAQHNKVVQSCNQRLLLTEGRQRSLRRSREQVAMPACFASRLSFDFVAVACWQRSLIAASGEAGSRQLCYAGF